MRLGLSVVLPTNMMRLKSGAKSVVIASALLPMRKQWGLPTSASLIKTSTKPASYATQRNEIPALPAARSMSNCVMAKSQRKLHFSSAASAHAAGGPRSHRA
jgi:hypothetical protein